MKRQMLMFWVFQTGILMCSLFQQQASAQYALVGTVQGADEKKPLSGVRVFIENTMIGAITSENGTFQISGIPEGRRCNLIVSAIGYEIWSQQFVSNSITTPTVKVKPDTIHIVLTPRPVKLPQVSVYGRRKQLDTTSYIRELTKLLIGISENAKQTVIINPEVLQVAINDEEQGGETVIATALKPLIIENKALGYRIHYSLTDCGYNAKSAWFEGHAFFEEIRTGQLTEQMKYVEARRRSYYGSMRHFLRALSQNSVAEEGFAMRIIPDVQNYFHKSPDAISVTTANISFAGKNMHTRLFSASPALEVRYLKAPMQGGILYELRGTAFNERKNNSQISLLLPKALFISYSTFGEFEEPKSVRLAGYYAWLRLADELPAEYVPN